MVGKPMASLLGLCILCGPAWRGAGGAELQEQSFRGFLYRGAGGHVWVGDFIAPLGMYGTFGSPPEWRLSAPMAKRWAPLVNQGVGDLRSCGHHDFWVNGFLSGETPLERVPRILVRFRGRYRLVEKREHKQEIDQTEWGLDLPKGWKVTSWSPASYIYEIVAVRLWDAELLGREWLLAWRRLDEALREVVAASLVAPGEAKRRRLAAAVEAGSQALNAGAHVPVDEAFRATLGKLAPKARVVRGYQLGYTWGYRSWADQFRRCVARLRIGPRTPLPAEPREPPVAEWLAEGRTAEEIAAETRRSCGEMALDRVALWLKSSRRLVLIGELTTLSQTELEEARAYSKARIEERKREAEKPKPPEPPRTREVEKLGIVASVPSDDVFARKLILGGILVEKRLPGGAAIGLQEGDIILNYRRVYDLVMGAYDARRALAQFANRYRRAHKIELRVLRGERIVTITRGK